MNPNITVFNVTLESEWTENSAAAGAGSAGRPIWKVAALGKAEIPLGSERVLHNVTLVADGMEPRTVKASELLANYTPVT